MPTRFIALAGPPKKKVKWAATHTLRNLRFCPHPKIMKWATLKWATHTLRNLYILKLVEIGVFFRLDLFSHKCGKKLLLSKNFHDEMDCKSTRWV